MTSDANSHLIKIRVERAFELLKEAQDIINLNYYNSGINRLYYACFSIVTALLLKHGYTVKTHSGARSLFAQHFVKTGKITFEVSKCFVALSDMRQDADYDFEVEYDEQTAKEYLGKSKEFVNVLELLIR